MRELTQVRDAVISALTAAGLPAFAAFPAEEARRYEAAVAAVDVGTAQGAALGFCNYLGQVRNEDGSASEVYGKQLEAEITVEIRAGRAADCQSGCEAAADVLLGGLPAGVRPEELSWEALQWERETELFLRRGRLRCRALFTARAEEEGQTFLDFVLKGVLTT